MQADLTLEVAGLDASATGTCADQALEVVHDDLAAAGVQPACAADTLDDDAPRRVGQFDIAGFRHRDIQIDAAYAEMKEIPENATRDIEDVILLVTHQLHFLKAEVQPAGPLDAAHGDDARLATVQRNGAHRIFDDERGPLGHLEGLHWHGDGDDAPVGDQRYRSHWDQRREDEPAQQVGDYTLHNPADDKNANDQ